MRRYWRRPIPNGNLSVQGTGMLSLPFERSQLAALLAKAELAPFGAPATRGGHGRRPWCRASDPAVSPDEEEQMSRHGVLGQQWLDQVGPAAVDHAAAPPPSPKIRAAVQTSDRLRDRPHAKSD